MVDIPKGNQTEAAVAFIARSRAIPGGNPRRGFNRLGTVQEPVRLGPFLGFVPDQSGVVFQEPSNEAAKQPPSRRPRKLNLEAARNLVKQNSDIANFRGIRATWQNFSLAAEQLRDYDISPADAYQKHRRALLDRFSDFFAKEESLNGNRALLPAFFPSTVSRESSRFFSRPFFTLDPEFGTPDYTVESFFEKAFTDESTGRLARWMKRVDETVRESSSDNLKAIDDAAKEGKRVKKGIVLVGGGPITSVVASVLAPYYDITVVTKQSSIGKPWRNRPIFDNSSTAVTDDTDGQRLPLLGGTTTPVGASQLANTLETDILLSSDTKEVICDDGTIRRYVGGQRVGDLVATNIRFNVDDFIVGQSVNPKDIQINPDGTKLLRLTGQEAGSTVTRELDADAVFFLTGPGEEKPVFADPSSRFEYLRIERMLNADITRARIELASIKEAIAQIETNSDSEIRDQDRQAILADLNQALKQVTVKTPRILTLSTVEKLYEFWDEDLERDPDKYPLRDIMDNGEQSVAFLGFKDTGRTLKELVQLKGPERSYPDGYNPDGSLIATVYNESRGAEVFNADVRPRYEGDLDESDVTLPYKADEILPIGNQGVRIVGTTPDGKTEAKFFKYAFVGTGFAPSNLEDSFTDPQIEISKLEDFDNNTIGLADEVNNIFIGGSATGFTAPDFPVPIQNIISGLEINENLLSLWVNGLLGELIAWTASTSSLKPNEQKIAALANK
jgi:hypothetical protein